MAFGVTGFAALRLEPQPQVFQALSLGAQAPVPPNPPYGSPNQNLVPVDQPVQPALPVHLTLAAQSIFQAILHINPSIAGNTAPGVPGAPNSTASVGAQNPSVTQLTLASALAIAPSASGASAQSGATAATGTVTFSATSSSASRTIPVGTVVQTANGTQFTVVADANQPGFNASLNAYVIAPGATSVNATVQANVPGSVGNVGAQSVSQFAAPSSAPAGVSVTNVAAFANGADAGAQNALLASVQGAIASIPIQFQINGNSGNAQVPQGPVSFSVTAPPASSNAAVQQTPPIPAPQAPANPTAPPPELDHELQKSLAANAPAPQPVPSSAPSIPPSSSPQYVLPSSGSAVARIVATVTQLAIGAIYPAPVFSFSA